MKSTVSGQNANSQNSFDLTPRERSRVSGKWVIVSYDGAADATSASDTEDDAWELFLESCRVPKAHFIRDGWKAVKMP